jgi:predicted alpha/beta-fold hydrolase
MIETPDGDELVLDHVDGAPGRPRAVLLHGLEGSSRSPYVRRLLAAFAGIGWSASAMNFRSCARRREYPHRLIPNRRPRLYHSGETADLHFVLRSLSARAPSSPLVAVGASLGGNVLLKWLGEHPDSPLLRAAVAISTPYDLAAGARHLERGAGRLYAAALLRSLRRKAIVAAERFPEAAERVDLGRVRRASTFFEFDEAATAPLHGFAGARDYYRKSSSLAYLSRIRIPTLAISARDDPFLPPEVPDRAVRAASPSVRVAVTDRGGHLGFVEGALPGRGRFWAEHAAVAFLAAYG